MTALQQHYRYLCPSNIEPGGGARLATSGGAGPNPYLFEGELTRPEQAVAALLVVARVARTRFYSPPGQVVARSAAADPVVTSDGERLRFESFSVCAGVHARLDVLPSGLSAEVFETGTTNVDLNPTVREALAGVGPEPLPLAVGAADHGEVAGGLEKRILLPRRWLHGLAEAQVAAAGMVALHELTPGEARRFVEATPRGPRVVWAVQASRGLRATSRPDVGSVCVPGGERLRVLSPVLRFATALRTYGPRKVSGAPTAASGWQLDLPGARLTLVLSADAVRGFPGDDAPTADAAQGGYDLADRAWFDRGLPYGADVLDALSAE